MRPLLLCTALAATLPCAAQTAPPVPITAFTTQDQYSRPRMSPDGKHLAVTVRIPVGKRLVPMLSFYSLPDLKLESYDMFKFGVGVRHDEGFNDTANATAVYEKLEDFPKRHIGK